MVAGHRYVFSFDVAAMAPEKISASVFDEARPGEPIFDAELWPATGMRHYKFMFYAPYSTPSGGVVFRLGGMAGAHTVFLDNVSLIHRGPA